MQKRGTTLISGLLAGEAENHLMPFFWQHGEDEATLRKYMQVIQQANCGAVCVESRPHPDFCGPKWWQDMDVILDEARTRGMKVWILDDSHFPTGYANGALKDCDEGLCRQSIFLRERLLEGDDETIVLNLASQGLLTMKEKAAEGLAAFLKQETVRVFHDDSLLGVFACNSEGQRYDLTGYVEKNVLTWQKPAGKWKLQVCVRTRNAGPHRDYINMTEPESCRILLDAVYEPHWQHYSADFGTTIEGFFSDEPELGNAELYIKGNRMGCEQDLPWGAGLEQELAEALGVDWRMCIPLLWGEINTPETARVRTVYMDVLTRRVQRAFSEQIGTWCREHGVRYIGHMIEDEGQHCRTGSGLGHYFRGLRGQDMSGVDDIGGQVLPQGEEEPLTTPLGAPRNGEFYHYGLAKLAESAAAIEPRKGGNAMCEIFGNYGWAEGIRLEKYLADHFLVRGINQIVPHAFSAAAFPDPDCPPHFYAHGHNPQYRWFGQLMAYVNRAATLTSSDRHIVHVAILYHGEAEWADAEAMPFETPFHYLYDEQIDCRVLPADIFSESEYFGTETGETLRVNGEEYQALIIPGAKTICKSAAEGASKLAENGMAVFFVGEKPEIVADTGEPLPKALAECPAVEPNHLSREIRSLGLELPVLQPENNRVRILQIGEKQPIFFIVNEGTTTYTGTLSVPAEGECFGYDALENRCLALETEQTEKAARIKLRISPLQSLVVVFGACPVPCEKQHWKENRRYLLEKWKRGTCESINYPNFTEETEVLLPDTLAEEQPEFSGFVRYETDFEGSMQTAALEIEDAGECVEVFLNGKSLGLRLVPPFHYDLRGIVRTGSNHLVIEVATTLERQLYPQLQGYQKMLAKKPEGASGLNGKVYIVELVD